MPTVRLLWNFFCVCVLFLCQVLWAGQAKRVLNTGYGRRHLQSKYSRQNNCQHVANLAKVFTFCPSAWADPVTVETDDQRLLPHPPHPHPPPPSPSPLLLLGGSVTAAACGAGVGSTALLLFLSSATVVLSVDLLSSLTFSSIAAVFVSSKVSCSLPVTAWLLSSFLSCSSSPSPSSSSSCMSLLGALGLSSLVSTPESASF